MYQRIFLKIVRSHELVIFIAFQISMIAYTSILEFFAHTVAIDNPFYTRFGATFISISTLIQVLPCAIFAAIFLYKQKVDLIQFLNRILIVGLLQVACVIVTMLFPEMRSWALADSGNQGFNDIFDGMGMFRMFGLAAGYTFAMPLFQGVCVIISYVLGCYRSSKYFLLIPFYLISIAVNARIGLISLVIPPLVILILQYKDHVFKQSFRIFFIVIFIIFCAQIVKYNAEMSSSKNTWVWLYTGIDEVISFEAGETKGNLAYLTDSMWFMPEGINILFGTGVNVFGDSNRSSDIGYVINLIYGGLVFSFLLYASYILLILQCFGKTMIEKSLKYSILVYLLIANLKGNAFSPHDLTFGIFTMGLFCLLSNKLSTEAGVTPRAIA